MLPIHRLAQHQAQQNSPLWSRVLSSKLATRVLVILTCVVFLLVWLSPSVPSHSGLFTGDPGYSSPEYFEHPPVKPPKAPNTPVSPPKEPLQPPHEDDIPKSPKLPPPHESPASLPTHQQPSTAAVSVSEWTARAEAVKKSFLHAWNSYEKAAWGADEILPVSNRSITNLNDWGVTIVDSLSTMLLMDLHDEYDKSMLHIAKMKFKDHVGTIAFFETTIRYLGGLLSAYALKPDPVILSRADELAATMLPTFNTESGLPMFGHDPSTKMNSLGWAGSTLLSEMASCQMEYKYLAHLTGKSEYFLKVDHVMEVMQKSQLRNGMWPTHWDAARGTGIDHTYTVGALADSAYEYLLKQYLLTGRSEKRLLDMYLKSVKGVLENMTFLSSTRNLLYVTALNGGVSPAHSLEHLACFYGGLLALGVEILAPLGDISPEDADLHRWAAEGLTNTCSLVYAESESGLGAEFVHFTNRVALGLPTKLWIEAVRKWQEEGGKTKKDPDGQPAVPPGVRDVLIPLVPGSLEKDYWYQDANYYSRPETLESMYIMYKVSKDEKWRHRAWDIYQNIEKHMKTPYGYGSIQNVDSTEPHISDSMPSYFLAETLKYLYLLFTEKDLVPFDKYIFNTEAHPLPVFHWTDKEKSSYNIR